MSQLATSEKAQHERDDRSRGELGRDLFVAHEAMWRIGAVITMVNMICALSMALMGERSWARVEAVACWMAGYLLSEWLRRRGREDASTLTLVGAGWATVAMLAWNSGGLDSIYIELYPLVIFSGGIMGGARLAWAMAALSGANTVAMWWAQKQGWLPDPTLLASSGGVLAQQLAISCAIAVGVGEAVASLRKARTLAEANKAKTEEAMNGFELLFLKSGAPMAVTDAEPLSGSKGLPGLASNAACEDLFGWPRGMMGANPGPHLDIWRERDAIRKAGRLIQEHGGFENLRALMRRRGDGSNPAGMDLVCEVSAKSVSWQGRDALLWTFRDLTNSESLATSLVDRAVNLELRAHKAAEQIDMAKREIAKQERLAQLGEMVAGVAHEMNVPIGNAKLSAEALERPAARLAELAAGAALSRSELSALADKAAESCEMTLANLERASEIITNFKQLTADQAGRARRGYGLSEVVDSALRMQAPSFRARSVEWGVTCSAEAQQARFDGYPGALSQIMTILAQNALAHAFDWDSASAEWTARIEVEVNVDSQGWARIDFKDNGKGMRADVAEKIFEPFFTTKAGRGGSGLGLAIAKNLASEALGGDLLLLAGPEGQGCCFELMLPPRAPGPLDPWADRKLRLFKTPTRAWRSRPRGCVW
jgi:signal transduction histidine kinase